MASRNNKRMGGVPLMSFPTIVIGTGLLWLASRLKKKTVIDTKVAEIKSKIAEEKTKKKIRELNAGIGVQASEPTDADDWMICTIRTNGDRVRF